MYANAHTKRNFLLRSHWRQWDWGPVTRTTPSLLNGWTRAGFPCLHWNTGPDSDQLSDLIGDVTSGSSLGCSDHALVEFTVLRHMGQAKSKARTQHFRRANFSSSRRSVGRPGKLPSRTREQNRADKSLRISPKGEELVKPRWKKLDEKDKRLNGCFGTC